LSARIEKLLGLASLQGLPLTGYRRFGVPPGGAFDQESYRLGNALLGNDPGALSIELSNASIQIVVSSSTRVSIVGAPVNVESTAAAHFNAAFDLAAGATLTLFAPREGLRTYLCVAGGWTPEGIDTDLGRAGHRLSAGEVLKHTETLPSGVVERLANPPSSTAHGPIHVLKGPQPLVYVAGHGLPLVVSNDSDRTGIRLDGFAPMETPELTSEPACAGTIQLTPSGQLIAFGPDGPTIAGYPKVAIVCAADLDRLAHLRPGEHVVFEEIDLARAHELNRVREARLSRTLAQLTVAATSRS
jgi:allophanate hydrolase subunit 2